MAPVIRFVVLTRPVPFLKPGEIRRVLQQEMGVAVTEIVEAIADTARLKAPVDRGILRSSIRTEVRTGAGPILVHGQVFTGTQAPYAPFVEFGTRPHWVPIAPLKGWAHRVLGDEELAWRVRWAIAQRGTKPRPYFGPAVAQVRPRFTLAIAAAGHRAQQRLEATGKVS